VNPITWVQGLDGTTLVVAICILMFVEETGVPLPFAPGDIVLALGGIAIAGGRVNPVVLVIAVSISITAGAIIGLKVPGVSVDDINTTTKTIPDFPGMWAAMLQLAERV